MVDALSRVACALKELILFDVVGCWVCNSPASPILANELHTRHPNPYSVLSDEPIFHAYNRSKAPVGKAFSYASIGEAGEKAFPAGAVSGKE